MNVFMSVDFSTAEPWDNEGNLIVICRQVEAVQDSSPMQQGSGWQGRLAMQQKDGQTERSQKRLTLPAIPVKTAQTFDVVTQHLFRVLKAMQSGPGPMIHDT